MNQLSSHPIDRQARHFFLCALPSLSTMTIANWLAGETDDDIRLRLFTEMERRSECALLN
jgi:hypothetical protein